MKFFIHSRKTQNQTRIIKEVRKVLGFKLKNISLYQLALRHKSYSKSSRDINNERLEYLGDAVIGLIVADYLFQKYPDTNEGELTKMRSRMVSRKHLNELAQKIGLGTTIPFRKQFDLPVENIQGNVFEALFGAIYLDRGYTKTQKIFLKLLDNHINIGEVALKNKDFKSLLQEWAQKERVPIKYKTQEIAKNTDSGNFEAIVLIDGQIRGQGKAANKRSAERRAARDAWFNFLGNEPNTS